MRRPPPSARPKRRVKRRGGQRVTARLSLVHDDHGHAERRRVPHVPEPGQDRQRRPEHHQRRRGRDERRSTRRPAAVARSRRRTPRPALAGRRTRGSPPRRTRPSPPARRPRPDPRARQRLLAAGPPRVRRPQPRVKFLPRRPLPARQAHHPVQRPVQLGHRLRARRLVQPVHVLRDDPASSPARSSAATARCPSFGAAPVMCRQPRCDRAQYRCRAAADPVNAW